MCADYVPTTEDVRRDYAAMRNDHMSSPSATRLREFRESGGGEGEFDRWFSGVGGLTVDLQDEQFVVESPLRRIEGERHGRHFRIRVTRDAVTDPDPSAWAWGAASVPSHDGWGGFTRDAAVGFAVTLALGVRSPVRVADPLG